MIWTSLDTIVCRNLLEKGLPRHYYLEALLHAATCLREQSFETLKMVNTVELPLNNYSAIDLPIDFADDVAVCFPSGQFLRPIPKNEGINPIRAHDSLGNFVATSDLATNPTGAGQLLFNFAPNWYWFWNINDFGEPTGRYFGGNGADLMNGYRVLKERGQIQLTETFQSDTAILVYISDGSSVDNATQIETLAWATIDSFINWKRSPNADNKDSFEGRNYIAERRKLVARLNPLTTTDIKQAMRENYHATIKN